MAISWPLLKMSPGPVDTCETQSHETAPAAHVRRRERPKSRPGFSRADFSILLNCSTAISLKRGASGRRTHGCNCGVQTSAMQMPRIWSQPSANEAGLLSFWGELKGFRRAQADPALLPRLCTGDRETLAFSALDSLVSSPES